MAAPVVAGAIALMLQKDKNLSHTEIAYLIKKNARKDTFSSFVENNTYGSGKLNVFQTLKYNYRFGCKLDTSAINYDSTIDFHRQDSCIAKVYGIMDTACINFDSFANVSGGVCVAKVYGCTDTGSINYNSLANIDNGTCIQKRYGIMDTACINYDSLANVSGGVCIAKVYGCTDTLAINYNPLANVNDGSCKYKGVNIQELEFSKISFYPNPAATSIIFENKNNNPIYIEIRNLYSQLIKKVLIDEKLILDVSNWARGVYFVQVVDNEFNSTKKMILK
jgi:hypothetical protein